MGGLNGHQLYQKMHAPDRFPDSLSDGSQAAFRLKTMHYDIATELASIRASMAEHWEGEAATAAMGKLETFLKSSAETAEKLDPSVVSMENQNEAFISTKNGMREMPAQPEEGSGTLVRIVTFGYADSPEEKQAQWDEQNRHNVDQYTKYAARSTGNESGFESDYQGVQDSRGGDGTSSSSSSGSAQRGSATPGVGGTGSGMGGGVGGYSGPTSASSTPQVNAPAAQWSAPSGSYPGGTTPAGYPAGGTSPAGSGPGGFGPGGFGPGAGGLGSGVGDEFGAGGRHGKGRSGAGGGAGAGAGAMAGFGPVGGGGLGAGGDPSAGGRAGGGLGAGGRVGAGMTGAGGPGGGAAMGGGVAAGRGGAGGGMMGGAGAGRGGGDDDKDHQRRYGLDSDEWFKPERDEDGGILRDPVTGMPVVPPVIGE